MLSPESQTMLKTLLPPTAFRGYQPVLEPSHPSAVDSMVVDQPTNGLSSDTLDNSVFTDPHFLAAAHTFQDHIYSDWLSDAHVEKVRQFEAGVRDGTLSAPWKDETWEKNNKATVPPMAEKGVASSSSMMELSTRAGYDTYICYYLQLIANTWGSEQRSSRSEACYPCKKGSDPGWRYNCIQAKFHECQFNHRKGCYRMVFSKPAFISSDNF